MHSWVCPCLLVASASPIVSLHTPSPPVVPARLPVLLVCVTPHHPQVMKSVQTPYQRLRLGDSNLVVALDKHTQVHGRVGGHQARAQRSTRRRQPEQAHTDCSQHTPHLSKMQASKLMCCVMLCSCFCCGVQRLLKYQELEGPGTAADSSSGAAAAAGGDAAHSHHHHHHHHHHGRRRGGQLWKLDAALWSERDVVQVRGD